MQLAAQVSVLSRVSLSSRGPPLPQETPRQPSQASPRLPKCPKWPPQRPSNTAPSNSGTVEQWTSKDCSLQRQLVDGPSLSGLARPRGACRLRQTLLEASRLLQCHTAAPPQATAGTKASDVEVGHAPSGKFSCHRSSRQKRLNWWQKFTIRVSLNRDIFRESPGTRIGTITVCRFAWEALNRFLHCISGARL